MTFLAPAFLYASIAVAVGVAALHFIVTRQPRAGVLPTARFVPDMPATATARATRPSDLPLMLLRMLLVLAAGAGLAKPVITPSRTETARVFLADVSRSVRDAGAIRDSIASLRQDGDVIIAFDSAATRLEGDSIGAPTPSRARGNVSAALIAAIRAGSELRERADSIDLVIVSPLAQEEFDLATDSVRKLWPGRVRLIVAGRPAVSSEPPAPSQNTLAIRGGADDPLRVTLARLSASAQATIVRDGSDAGDAVGTILSWPASTRPMGSVLRERRDSTGGVVAGDELVVATFERRWRYPADSLRGGEVVARWIDGEAAAVEWPRANGCTRSVAIPVTPVGDLVIRNDFVRLTDALFARCISLRSFIPASATQQTSLAGSGSLASREAFRPRGDARSWLAPWLLGMALVLAVAELFLRRRKAQVVAASNPSRLASAA